jgi:hypothetical protein
LPSLFPLILAHAKNLLQSLLHLIVPLRPHSILLDPLPLKHVSYVTLNLESNSLSSVLTHGLHILKIGELNARDRFIGCKVVATVSIGQEGLPVAGILDVVREETGVVKGLNVGPHVLRVKNTANGLKLANGITEGSVHSVSL